MKLAILKATAALLLLSAFTAPPVEFTLSGQLNDYAGMVELYDGQEVIGSANVSDGLFTMNGTAQSPCYGLLKDADGRNIALVLIEPGEINLTQNGDNIAVKGTQSNDLNASYNALIDALRLQLSASNLTEDAREEIYSRYDEITMNHYRSNVNNLFGLFLFTEQISRELEPDEIYAEIEKFDTAWQEHKYMDMVRDRAEKMRKTAVGAPYMEITLPDTEGNQLSLSDYIGEGKYVLIDFWASWCGPCMAEVPHLKAAYDEFHPLGFEIFGVSLDQKRDAWLKCISDKQLNWIHVSSVSGWDCPARLEYGVDGIPASFLIGPDGHIVARNLRGKAVSEKLGELLK